MPTDAQSSQEISGPTAFWILASLAAAAVVLPPASSRLSGRELFGGNIDLVRSFPGICLFDAIIDLVFLGTSTYKALSSPKPAQRTRRAFPGANVIAAKLMLSIFAVFPQMIKALSLKGVPATQFCAFVFFFAFITRFLIDLCGLELHEPAVVLVDGDEIAELVVLLGLLFQAPFEVWIWHNISFSIQFQLPEGIHDFVVFLSFACNLVAITQLAIWLCYVAARRRFNISGSPYIVPMRLFFILHMIMSAWSQPMRHKDLQSTPVIRPLLDFTRRFSHAIGLMVWAILLSIAVAKVLGHIGKLVFQQAAITKTADASPQTEEISVNDQERIQDEGIETETTLVASRGEKVGMICAAIDRWTTRALSLNSAASFTMMLTVFNLITTVIYYLVYFDGSGTTNPGWTSVLG
ncbi:hypothetical protein ACLX1H_005447 [Fusarium chlamydosporum]